MICFGGHTVSHGNSVFGFRILDFGFNKVGL